MNNDPFKEYIIQAEPNKRDKGYAWHTAIGLQAVDGLKPSEYLIHTAIQNIEGKISIDEAQKLLNSYYEENPETDGDRTEEADKVSVQIAKILTEKAFSFTPNEYISIHKRLFTGIYKHAGKIRDYNITKKEWVLNGDTVYYASYNSIKETLDYDFQQEKEFSYEELSAMESVKHIAKFTAGIWQIHPFCEGNTRSIAVFIIKYLKTFGFTLRNDVFAENSWYFRNALVRANYNNYQNNVYADTEYLEKFFENLLLGYNNELKNRYLHVDYVANRENAVQSASNSISKCKNFTLEESALLHAMAKNPSVTQKELAGMIGKSERTVKTRTVELQQKGCLRRENGKRNGRWEVLISLPDEDNSLIGMNGR